MGLRLFLNAAVVLYVKREFQACLDTCKRALESSHKHGADKKVRNDLKSIFEEKYRYENSSLRSLVHKIFYLNQKCNRYFGQYSLLISLKNAAKHSWFKKKSGRKTFLKNRKILKLCKK